MDYEKGLLPDQVLAVAEIIGDRRSKAMALCEVAQVLIQIGEEERAVAIASQALATAEAIK